MHVVGQTGAPSSRFAAISHPTKGRAPNGARQHGHPLRGHVCLVTLALGPMFLADVADVDAPSVIRPTRPSRDVLAGPVVLPTTELGVGTEVAGRVNVEVQAEYTPRRQFFATSTPPHRWFPRGKPRGARLALAQGSSCSAHPRIRRADWLPSYGEIRR